MKETTIERAIIHASIVIGLSVILGCFIISRTPRFEKVGGPVGGVLIETRTGSIYERREGNPSYFYIPGPKSFGVQVDPVFSNPQ